MMSPWRVVVVHQAESMLVPKRESDAAARALEDLEAYLQRPLAQTVLVLVAAPLDRRSRMFKLLSKQATLVDCGVIEDQAAAEQWIRARVAAVRSVRRLTVGACPVRGCPPGCDSSGRVTCGRIGPG
jgi:DNA polymerase III delta subunit